MGKEFMLNTNRHRILVTENNNLIFEVKPISEKKWKTLLCLWENEGDIEILKEAIKYLEVKQDA